MVQQLFRPRATSLRGRWNSEVYGCGRQLFLGYRRQSSDCCARARRDLSAGIVTGRLVSGTHQHRHDSGWRVRPAALNNLAGIGRRTKRLKDRLTLDSVEGDVDQTSDLASMNEEDKSYLLYARRWLRNSPGPDAWANLAAVYATKHPADLKRARSWYRRAALKGHHRGLFEYGLMLLQGEGGPKRLALGRRYLERAAALGQVGALPVLWCS